MTQAKITSIRCFSRKVHGEVQVRIAGVMKAITVDLISSLTKPDPIFEVLAIESLRPSKLVSNPLHVDQFAVAPADILSDDEFLEAHFLSSMLMTVSRASRIT
jgi:hypothetical protein